MQSPSFLKLFCLLADIYKAVLIKTRLVYNIDGKNSVFLSLILGELFENPLIPKELFFNDRSKSVKKIESILEEEQQNVKTNLDDNFALSPDLTYAFQSPYLQEIKRVLLQKQEGFQKPKSEKLPLKRKEKKRIVNQLQTELYPTSQMEKIFLQNLPVSVSDTVKFVSAKVESNLTDQISVFIIPKAITEVKSQFRNGAKIAFSTVTEDEKEIDRIKDELASQINSLSESYCSTIREQARQYLLSEVSERIHSLLVLALPIALLKSPMTVDRIAMVTKNKVVDQTMQWIRQFITERK